MAIVLYAFEFGQSSGFPDRRGSGPPDKRLYNIAIIRPDEDKFRAQRDEGAMM